MKDILRSKIVQYHKNYMDMDTIIGQKTKEIEEKKLTLSSGDLEASAELLSNFYIDTTLMVSDQKIIFNKLILMIDIYKELSYDGLPEEVLKFYNSHSMFFPKEIFVIKDGNLMEKEDGLLEKERKAFLESDLFKNIMKQKQ